MNEKLPITLKNLISWTDKILNDSKGREWRLYNFISAFNVKDFVSFYNELIPFVKELRKEDIELFDKYIINFENNKTKLDEACQEYWLAELAIKLLTDTYFWGRSADDLIEVIKDIKTNAENISYSLKVFKS